MIRFTKSKDGAERCSIRVTYRLDRSALVEAIALECEYEHDEIPKLSRETAEKILRAMVNVSGNPDYWVETDSDEMHEARRLAEVRVGELWP